MLKEKGWKPIPLSLKILSVFLALWVLGSFMALPGRYELGLPFFGVWVSGLFASLIVLVLDIVGPITFLFGLWSRKSWAVPVAFTYIGIFVLNSLVALFTVREQLGLMSILIPSLVNIIFLTVIYMKRSYFK